MATDKETPTKEDKAAEERTEYFKKLEKWLHEAYAWQSMAAMFPYYLMSGQIVNSTTGIPPITTQVPNVVNAHRLIVGTSGPQNDPHRHRRGQEQAGTPLQPTGAEGFEYRIPSVWKRLAAELIDTAMFLLLKFFITFVAINVFDFIDLDDLGVVGASFSVDYRMTLEISYGMLVTEVIHKIIVCIFEAFWLRTGVNGRIGGATPGKSVMGLRVVKCRSVTSVDRPEDPDVVLVSPGTDLGLPLALGRSFFKNLILAVLLPIRITFFFFRYNRTFYDLLSNSIVVEDPHRNLNNNNRLHQQ